MRRPAVAGQFYSEEREDLVTEIEACYSGTMGPGVLPDRIGEGRSLAGLVVPHAGYVYSGPVASHAYLALAKDGLPECFVILGPNHTGHGMPLALAMDDFETPLGVARIDKELADDLAKGALQKDEEAHRYEHSIEVQLPFLLHLKEELKFVPICMGAQDFESAKMVGSLLADALQDRDVVIIASTDFSHYVPREVATSKDRMAIDRILAGDPRGLYDVVMEQNVTMCGYGPVMATLVALGRTKGELLKYGTSGDVHPMRDVVGYASITLGM
ncbi:MAG: AmmeMemoRadiSam system protein B [Candidatus Thermoplasmatota archaeon]|nr:AmmeMemoRadiSam system protein B [Candidatus Thermoplasmatota archaeon]